MKLLKLHIDNFGTLRDYDYTFCDGLNVFREDNGWGKSTMAAFLKAMLYGFGTKRSRDITENERKRYLPWQGRKYGKFCRFWITYNALTDSVEVSRKHPGKSYPSDWE